METYKKNWLKFVTGLVVCLLVRLLPFRPPNIEPILAVQMPFSKVYGAYVGFLFAILSIVLYDLITGTLGMWSLVTAGAYGVLGLGAAVYFKKNNANVWGFVRYAIFGTLFFDAVTGLTVGPLLFHQSFASALVGQIPFTMMHLLGNVSFAVLLSPAIYSFMIKKKKSETKLLINTLNPQKI